MTRAATADVSLFYADASALVKLIHEESATAALRSFVAEADLVTSDLALTEVARAIRRAAAAFPEVDMGQHLEQAAELFESIGLLPLDRDVLLMAGALTEPALRSLDAIHVAAALTIPELDAFVSYDERQAAAARLSGLRTLAPGA